MSFKFWGKKFQRINKENKTAELIIVYHLVKFDLKLKISKKEKIKLKGTAHIKL